MRRNREEKNIGETNRRDQPSGEGERKNLQKDRRERTLLGRLSSEDPFHNRRPDLLQYTVAAEGATYPKLEFTRLYDSPTFDALINDDLTFALSQ